MRGKSKGIRLLRRLSGCSGQVEVETAVVMPAVVFILLGLMQMGMLHQARLFAEYAAYRAVRAGVVKNANIEEMETAGLAAALPVLSRNSEMFGGDGMEVLDKTHTPEKWKDKWYKQGFGSFLGGIGVKNRMTDTGMKYVQVDICHPLKGDVSGHTYSYDGDQIVPFDDPAVAGVGDKTKLVIELTMNYRLPIPFADWVMWHMVNGRDIIQELRVGENKLIPEWRSSGALYEAAAYQGIYILPIRAQYAMKMHSDFKVDTLPDENVCHCGGGPDEE